MKSIIKTAVFFLFISIIPFWGFAQVELTGKITDGNKELAGANISVISSKSGTTSDKEGHFSLILPERKTWQIKVSYVGFESREIEVDLSKENPQPLNIKLTPATYSGDEIVVTATRSRQNISEVPGSIRVISKKEIEKIPAQKVDDIIQHISGVNAFRPQGILSMRPVVTLRGLSGDEQGRTLVLIDGVPVNKGDTGGVNWNRLDKNNIEKIEIYHGPGSGLYGNYAMGGVINIITGRPGKKAEGSAGMSYGSYNTQQANINFGSSFGKKFWTSASAFFTNSDGYNPVPDSLRTQPDYSVPRFLNEKGISLRTGLDQSKAFNLKLRYDYYKDKRGEGEKIKAPYGEYRHFNTHFLNASAQGETSLFSYQASVFYQKENYFKLDERMKSGNYARFDVNSDRIDQGILLHLRRRICPRQIISLGFDSRTGSVEGGDFYVTSPDSVVNSGKMNLTGFYLQDEVSLLNKQLTIVAGLRYDMANFYDGSYSSTDNAWTGVLPDLESHRWNALTPRIAFNWKIAANSKLYISYARGFRASILDDLTRSGWMWVGPKIANPDLEPEKIDNYEAGTDIEINEQLSISASAFYSQGTDFLYYVRTGDSLFGSRPVYQRQNVTGVKIFGTELKTEIFLNRNLNIFASYTFNHSEISSFEENPMLEGKALKYTPAHQVKATLFWTNRIVNSSISFIYKGKQFINDENTESIDPWFTADVKFSKDIDENFSAYVSLMNLFNDKHMDNELYLSPGRWMTLGFEVRF